MLYARVRRDSAIRHPEEWNRRRRQRTAAPPHHRSSGIPVNTAAVRSAPFGLFPSLWVNNRAGEIFLSFCSSPEFRHLMFTGTSLVILLVVLRDGGEKRGSEVGILGLGDEDESVKAEQGVVATDDERCSQIGVAALRAGGNAVDAAVAAAFCLGVVNPMSSGIGGGAFILVRISAAGKTEAFDCRETAPLASSQVRRHLCES